jgi:hypothetical protein
MISNFAIFALFVSFIAMFREDGRKEAILVFANLASFAYINQFDPHQVGIYHYVTALLIDFTFLYFATKEQINKIISFLFLFSIIFNAASYIEYSTYYSYIYDAYSEVMKSIIVGLIVSIYLTRKKDESEYGNRLARSFTDYSNSGISSRGTL